MVEDVGALTEKYLSQLSTFHTGSLRRILRIFWLNVISNKDVFRRRCRWIGHVTRQDPSIAKPLYTGHLKGNARKAAPRAPDGGQ